MEITIGRTVLYRLNEWDVKEISDRKQGNYADIGDIVPLIVVKVWPNEYGDKPGVNGQAILDGPGTLWVTSRAEGTDNGTWHWPPRV